MRNSNYKLESSDLDQLINYLIEHVQFNYENHSSDMSVLSAEQRYVWSKGYQHNMVIAKKKESHILIDIMVMSSDQTFYSFKAASQKNFIHGVEKVIREYSKKFKFPLMDA